MISGRELTAETRGRARRGHLVMKRFMNILLGKVGSRIGTNRGRIKRVKLMLSYPLQPSYHGLGKVDFLLSKSLEILFLIEGL